MPRKKPKVIKSVEQVKVKDLPADQRDTLVKYGGKTPEDVLTENIGYRVGCIDPKFVDGVLVSLRAGVLMYSIAADNTVTDLPRNEAMDITVTTEAQPGVPPQDIVDPETGDVLVAANSTRLPIPSLDEFVDLTINGKQVKATSIGQLLDNVTFQALQIIQNLYPALAGATVIDMEPS